MRRLREWPNVSLRPSASFFSRATYSSGRAIERPSRNRERYLVTSLAGASIMHGYDTERHGYSWSISHNDTTMMLNVTREFLPAQTENEVRAHLRNFDVARALRGSAGRAVLLSREGITFSPQTPA
jgi:hypothetical protein